jgi:hypothetical protein
MPTKKGSTSAAPKGDRSKTRDLSASFQVDENPRQAFAAINNVRGWWSGEIEGRTDTLGAEWTYRYKDVHYSKQKITELVPGKKVAWRVLDSYLSFVKDKTEWNGTEITFEVSRKGDKTEVRFTHHGLLPEVECFGACRDAWGFYVRRSLKSLIATGKGQPKPEE